MFGLFEKEAVRHVAASDVGKRYTHNEDAFILAEENATWEITDGQIDALGRLYVLCDGMGGGKAGEVASSLAAGWVARDFYSEPLDGEDPGKRIVSLICGINGRLHALAQDHDAYEGMGTTLVAAHIRDNRLNMVSIGDSRGYLFRNGRLRQLTEDHSEIWPLYTSGSLTKEDLRTHPRSHVLVKALVVSKTVTAEDLCTVREELLEDDLLFLCSDGLTDMVAEKEIEDILRKKKKMKWKAEQMVAAANRNGGRDNITVILVKV